MAVEDRVTNLEQTMVTIASLIALAKFLALLTQSMNQILQALRLRSAFYEIIPLFSNAKFFVYSLTLS